MSNQGQTNIESIDGAINPSSFIIEQALLFPSNKTEPVDFRDLILDLNIVESLSSPFIEAEAFLQDAGNFLSRLRMNGNEKIKLKIQRRKMEGSEQPDENQKWELDLIATELYDYSRTKPSRQFYKLRMNSPHLVINSSKTLKRVFKGSLTSIISGIIKDDLKVPVDRLANLNQGSGGSVKGIYPYLSPIKAANWLLNNAYDEETPFFFYETCHKGLYLQSLNDMYNKNSGEPYKTYELKSFFEHKVGSPEHYDELAIRILKFSSPINYSQNASIISGAYAAKGNFLDIFNKTYKPVEYRYSDNKKLNKFQPFSKNDKVNDQPLNNLVESREYYINQNPGAFDSGSNIHSPLNSTILRGEAHYLALNTNTMEIVLNGDFGLEVGNIIKLDVSKASSADQIDEFNMFDKYLGTKYLVQKIESNFGEAFKQRVTIVRDSVGIDIDSKEPEEVERNET